MVVYLPILLIGALIGAFMSLVGFIQSSTTQAFFGLFATLFFLSVTPGAIRMHLSRRRSVPELEAVHDIDSEAATAVPRLRWLAIAGVVMLAMAIVSATYFAYALTFQDTSEFAPGNRRPFTGILLTVAILLATWLLIRAAYSARRKKFLWLAPSRVHLSDGFMYRSVEWDSILDVQATSYPSFATIRLQSRPDGVDIIWAARWARKKNRTWLAEVYTLEYDMDSALLYHLIRFYWKHPELRQELGSDAAVNRIRRSAVLDSPEKSTADRNSGSDFWGTGS